MLVKWKDSARAELFEILDYISDFNPNAAIRLNDRIDHLLEHISQNPYMYQQSDRVPLAREVVAHPNYVMFYVVTDNAIEVLAVVHARRDYP